MAQFYKKRRDRFENALRQHMKGLAEWTSPDAGMFLWWVRFAYTIELDHLSNAVSYFPGLNCYLKTQMPRVSLKGTIHCLSTTRRRLAPLREIPTAFSRWPLREVFYPCRVSHSCLMDGRRLTFAFRSASLMKTGLKRLSSDWRKPCRRRAKAESLRYPGPRQWFSVFRRIFMRLSTLPSPAVLWSLSNDLLYQRSLKD